MKVKTSELSGMALCYAVCMIEMPHLIWGKTIGKHHASNQIVVPELPEDKCYGPFASWRMFGPIIEREKIELIPLWLGENFEGYASSHRLSVKYDSDGEFIYGSDCKQYGPTALIAAMRCYCCTILGDEVDIPEALL